MKTEWPPWKPGERVTMAACHEPGLRWGVSCGRAGNLIIFKVIDLDGQFFQIIYMSVVPIEKSMIGLAGETRVCAELLKKGFLASITHGNAKATDILIIGRTNRFIRVEVKTSVNGRNFVTGYYPKYDDSSRLHPDLWVFYLPDKELSTGGDRFFVASHEQVGEFQLEVNKGRKTLKSQGCDNIPLKLLLEKGIEDKWSLVSQLLAE